MTIRIFTPDDLEGLLAVQKEATGAAQWGAADYARLAASPGGLILVAEAGGGSGIVGFAAMAQMADEAELRNIAVRPLYQRQGVGRRLLEQAHERLLEAGVNRLYLEVRPSNRAAVELYRSLGYSVRAERRKYYQDPPEDALVLGLELVAKEE